MISGAEMEKRVGAIKNFNDTNLHHHRWVQKPINLTWKNRLSTMVWKPYGHLSKTNKFV